MINLIRKLNDLHRSSWNGMYKYVMLVQIGLTVLFIAMIIAMIAVFVLGVDYFDIHVDYFYISVPFGAFILINILVSIFIRRWAISKSQQISNQRATILQEFNSYCRFHDEYNNSSRKDHNIQIFFRSVERNLHGTARYVVKCDCGYQWSCQ